MTDDAGPRAVQGMRVDCPDGWLDKSMLILSATEPGKSGATPTFVVARAIPSDDLPVDRVDRLETFVERQLTEMATALAGFAIVARVNATAEQWTAELTIDWDADQVPLRQWITYAEADGGAIVVATATAGRSDFAGAEPRFRAMLRTVRMF